jgi:hypothetical protein
MRAGENRRHTIGPQDINVVFSRDPACRECTPDAPVKVPGPKGFAYGIWIGGDESL